MNDNDPDWKIKHLKATIDGADYIISELKRKGFPPEMIETARLLQQQVQGTLKCDVQRRPELETVPDSG